MERYEFLTTRHADKVARFKALEAGAAKWERAAKLRAFADANERQLPAVGELSADQADWLAWGRAKAALLDPLVLVSDVILDAPGPKRPTALQTLFARLSTPISRTRLVKLPPSTSRK